MRALAMLLVSVPSLLVACGTVEEPVDVLDCGEVAGVLACHTFEAEDPAWTSLESNGVAALDDRQAAGGDRSLRAQVSAMGGKAVRTRGVAGASNYFARFYAQLPTGADATGIALLHLGEPGGTFLGTNVEIGGGNLGVGIQTADIYDYPMPMPRDRWVCVELEVAVSDTGGRVILRADGATVIDRMNVDTLPAAPIGDLEVGISYSSGAGSIALIDDVVVASQPLDACP